MRTFIFASLAFMTLFACSGTDFSSERESSGSKVANDDQIINEDDPNNGAEENKEVIVVEDTSTCWVAISGTLFGGPRFLSDGNTVDPQSPYAFKGNEPPTIVHPEFGDAVLKVRKEAYVYQDSGHEVDGAIDHTLDSVMITPGVEVFLAEEGGDPVKYTGPALLSTIGPNTAFISDHFYIHIGFYLSKEALLPPWLALIIKSSNKAQIMPFLSLRSVRSIKVTKIPGVSCKS